MLKIENLTKIYGDKRAVDNLSLEIKNGEICGFIGHNGAGKTTTIKSCCRLVDFEQGEVYVNGISIKEKPIECKKIMAYLPDNPDLYDFMTGIRYLNFVADMYGMDGAYREGQINRYAEMFEIKENLAQPINSYSHGMKQKLAIISAFMHDPKLILMDEPFVGLDPKASHKVKQEMKRFCSEGAAILFSTHVLEVAEKLCDKVAIISGGKLIVSGDTEDIIGNASLEDVFLELWEDDEETGMADYKDKLTV